MHARRRLQYQLLLFGQRDIPIIILHNQTPVSATSLSTAVIALHKSSVCRRILCHARAHFVACVDRKVASHLGIIDSSPVCMNNTCFCAYLYSNVRRVHGAVHGIVPLPHIVHTIDNQHMIITSTHGARERLVKKQRTKDRNAGCLSTNCVSASVKSTTEPFLTRGDTAPGGSTVLRCRKLAGNGKFCL